MLENACCNHATVTTIKSVHFMPEYGSELSFWPVMC